MILNTSIHNDSQLIFLYPTFNEKQKHNITYTYEKDNIKSMN